MTEPNLAEGWYVDPLNSANERWWTGTEWSNALRPVSGAAADTSANPASIAAPSAESAARATSSPAASSDVNIAAGLKKWLGVPNNNDLRIKAAVLGLAAFVAPLLVNVILVLLIKPSNTASSSNPLDSLVATATGGLFTDQFVYAWAGMFAMMSFHSHAYLPNTSLLMPLLIDLVVYVLVIRLVAKRLKSSISSAREAALFTAVGSLVGAIIVGVSTYKAINVMGYQLDITYNWFEALLFVTLAAFLAFPGTLGSVKPKRWVAVLNHVSRITLRLVAGTYFAILVVWFISLASFANDTHINLDFGTILKSLVAGIIFAPNIAFGGATWGLGEPLSAYLPAQFTQIMQMAGQANPLEKLVPYQVVLALVTWLVIVVAAATVGSKREKSANAVWEYALAGAGLGLLIGIFTNFDMNGVTLGPGYFAPIFLLAIVGVIFGAFEHAALASVGSAIAKVAKPVAGPVVVILKKIPLINKL